MVTTVAAPTTSPCSAVQVFNADYSPLDRVSWRDAISMLVREVALTLEPHDPPRVLHSPTASIELPKSLLLVRYATVPYRRLADHASRAEILARDGHVCQFAGCGTRATTIDHVFPRSRGGDNTWFNLVASCESCNGRKADRTPSEAGMRLVREPFRPPGV
jgi:5-methylcytosine-specific restriction endonuclease McrA